MRKPLGFTPEARTATAPAIHRRRASGDFRKSASIEYAATTTHPRKKPPWQLAQIRNNGGSSHIQRRASRIAMVAASSRKVNRYGRSTANPDATPAVANVAANAP